MTHAEGWATILAALVVIAVLGSASGVAATHQQARPVKRTAVPSAPVTTPYAVDPSAFSPGACVAFPPTTSDRHLTVFLDAGHGGFDSGTIGTTQAGQTIYEADETLPVELDTMTMLRDHGFRVVVSRTGPNTVARLSPDAVSSGGFSVRGARDEVAARDVCANEANANALVGIYFNGGGSPQNAGSITAYDPDRPFTTQNLLLANLVQRDVLMAMNARGWAIPDAGVRADTGLGSVVSSADASYGHLLLLGPAKAGYFSTPSQMPGALIEPLFITDPFEGSIAASGDGQQAIAGALAQAIEQYLAPQ